LPRAWNLLRPQPWYRHKAFSQGLSRAGFEVSERAPREGRPGDVLLIWNRYGTGHALATQFEAEGGTVLVAENGYLGAGGTSPKFDVHPGGPKPHHYYALAVGGHNGQGDWPDGGPERFEALGVVPKPWRQDGGHVLVCPNRSFGVPGRIMPADWAEATATRLRRETKREVRVRAHPGNDAPKRPLAADLEGAWAAVIWSSGAGLQALVAGVPVFVASGWWVCKGAAARGPIDAPEMPDRLPHLRRMAWAQWRVEEIEAGVPFARLLSAAR
jgi:hypothetical protein